MRQNSKPTTEEIFSKITEVLLEYGVPKRKISLNANFAKDMGLDSLDLAGLMMEVEYYFQIYIPNRDMDQFNNMYTTAQYILDTLKE